MAGVAAEHAPGAGETAPGPMARVLGVPLIERNLLALLKAGVSEVAVLVAGSTAAAGPVRAWAQGRGRSLAEAAGTRLDVVEDPSGRGEAGALTLVPGSDRPILQVRADNLTSLDLAGLVDAHERAWADLTLAVHDQAFRLPYAVVQHDKGVVTGYQEAPLAAVPVASGVIVVGPRALAILAGRSSPRGIADLVRRAVEADLAVRAVTHARAWVNVNDARSLEQAVALVRADPDAFELCWPDPVPQTVLPGTGGTRVRIDDLDANGRPCRVEVPQEPGPGAMAAVDDLGGVMAARVRAWLADLTKAGPPGRHSSQIDGQTAPVPLPHPLGDAT